MVRQAHHPEQSRRTISNDQNSKFKTIRPRRSNISICKKRCRDFVRKLPKTIINIEDGKQLVKASGSQAANYIEANEALSKKDFAHRIKICRKEAKESKLWLRLCNIGNRQELAKEQKELIQEATELTKIFSSILEKSK